MLKPAFETSSLVPANRPRERRRAGRREAALRKHRIFARLAEGRSHAAIAREENCSLQWIRRIIAEALQARRPIHSRNSESCRSRVSVWRCRWATKP